MYDQGTIAQLAGYITQYQEAYDAAYQAAKDEGLHQPRGLMERAASGHYAYQYGWGAFEQTPRVQSRMQAALPELARQGAVAYVSGQPGNAYTRYLRNWLGPYQG